MKTTQNAPLAARTSLHAGGEAENLIELEASDNLTETLKTVSGPVLLLGYGTNCLISDKELPGTVIIDKSGTIEKLSPQSYKVASGVNWDEFIIRLINDGCWGLEFTSGIPGGTGAAVAGNIAAYGHRVADSFVEAEVMDTADGSITTWGKDKFEFDYRSSSIQRPENASKAILSATFRLSPQLTSELDYESALKCAEEIAVKPDSLENRRKIIMETRRRAGSLLQNPTEGPYTAGSFFKNPLVSEEQIQTILSYEEHGISREQLIRQNVIHGGNRARVSAAHVLLAAGFKRGQAWGNVRLHPEHILKVENLGNASAQEIYDVVQQILQTVHDKLGIALESEVRFLGEF